MHYTQLNLFDITPYQKSQVAEAEIDQPSQAEILYAMIILFYANQTYR